MFQPQNFLVEAVNNRDIEQVRVALSTYLSKNPTNEQNEVTQAAEYAESRLSEPLWVEHDDMYIEKDSSKWTTDYLGQLKSDLRYNFSKERFLFIIEVGKKVRPFKGKINPVQTTVQTIRKPDTQSSSQAATKETPVSTRVTDPGKPNTKWLVIAGLGGLAILGVALFLLAKNHK
ncbi:hypothetical protein [Paenibacillus sp. URB8-2]|uniref:hypothetical protein n=1 Tax=Paenibacillus sp. URB8-2 TaxID=2741301 RepID=UPI0015C07EBD|nr:hypothetical protein [Paenibacillus sp. URB8-2]BCG58115.1 hypothetical protein PUR_15400 [Paenibacillus sp. URB8-2]